MARGFVFFVFALIALVLGVMSQSAGASFENRIAFKLRVGREEAATMMTTDGRKKSPTGLKIVSRRRDESKKTTPFPCAFDDVFLPF